MVILKSTIEWVKAKLTDKDWLGKVCGNFREMKEQ